MKLLIVAVGTRMPAWVSAGFEDYARRMPREARFRLIEVKPEPRAQRGSRSSAALAQAEEKRIRAALPAACSKVALDEHGAGCTTLELARKIEAWRTLARDVAFIIGGPDGLSAALKGDADFVWSLSPLTLPHGLARVVVAEQLYRAHSVLNNHPYHRE